MFSWFSNVFEIYYFVSHEGFIISSNFFMKNYFYNWTSEILAVLLMILLFLDTNLSFEGWSIKSGEAEWLIELFRFFKII
jgi:hypothetical protein